MTPKPPVHEVTLGRVRAAVWENLHERGTSYSVTLSRLYKDKESGEWRDSDSFGRDDLPLVAKVSDLAHTWIFQQRAAKPDAAQVDDELFSAA
jgi:hypothetical protein